MIEDGDGVFIGDCQRLKLPSSGPRACPGASCSRAAARRMAAASSGPEPIRIWFGAREQGAAVPIPAPADTSNPSCTHTKTHCDVWSGGGGDKQLSVFSTSLPNDTDYMRRCGSVPGGDRVHEGCLYVAPATDLFGFFLVATWTQGALISNR